MHFSIINLGTYINTLVITPHVQLQLTEFVTVDSCVYGYHEYSAIWEPVMGEKLQCDIGIICTIRML